MLGVWHLPLLVILSLRFPSPTPCLSQRVVGTFGNKPRFELTSEERDRLRTAREVLESVPASVPQLTPTRSTRSSVAAEMSVPSQEVEGRDGEMSRAEAEAIVARFKGTDKDTLSKADRRLLRRAKKSMFTPEEIAELKRRHAAKKAKRKAKAKDSPDGNGTADASAGSGDHARPATKGSMSKEEAEVIYQRIKRIPKEVSGNRSCRCAIRACSNKRAGFPLHLHATPCVAGSNGGGCQALQAGQESAP